MKQCQRKFIRMQVKMSPIRLPSHFKFIICTFYSIFAYSNHNICTLYAFIFKTHLFAAMYSCDLELLMISKYSFGQTYCTLHFFLPSYTNCNHFLSRLQSIITLDGGALVQVQKWDGKTTTITRKIEGDKLVLVSIF